MVRWTGMFHDLGSSTHRNRWPYEKVLDKGLYIITQLHFLWWNIMFLHFPAYGSHVVNRRAGAALFGAVDWSASMQEEDVRAAGWGGIRQVMSGFCFHRDDACSSKALLCYGTCCYVVALDLMAETQGHFYLVRPGQWHLGGGSSSAIDGGPGGECCLKAVIAGSAFIARVSIAAPSIQCYQQNIWTKLLQYSICIGGRKPKCLLTKDLKNPHWPLGNLSRSDQLPGFFAHLHWCRRPAGPHVDRGAGPWPAGQRQVHAVSGAGAVDARGVDQSGWSGSRSQAKDLKKSGPIGKKTWLTLYFFDIPF